MIKWVEWLLGRRADALKDEHTAAVQDVQMSRALRASSERIGAEQRRRLARDGFGAAFEAAFYANDRRGRQP
jgi:hypothetical protein